MEFGDRIMAIYDAAFARDRWRPALDAIQSGTETAGVMFYDISRNRPIEYGASGISTSYAWIADHIPDYNKLVADPERGTGLDAEGSAFMHRQPAFEATRDDTLWPIDAAFLARSEIEFTRTRMKMFRRFFVNLSEDPASHAALLAHYPNDYAGPPRSDDMRHVEMLAPHFGKALELNRAMHALRHKHDAALAALDLINVAICIVQESGHVVLKNRCAEALFSRRDGIWVDRFGKLACTLPEDAAMLSDATARISRTAAGTNADRGHQQKLTRASNAQPLLAVVSPLRDADMELERGLKGALLTILDGAASTPLDPNLLETAFDLSAAEARLLPALLHGKTNKEIAAEADVSPETVKSHVSSILAKTGSRNRLMLLWRLFQWSPPVL